MAEKATLQDVLSYRADDYFTHDDVACIRHHLDDPKFVAVLRKAFLPTLHDEALPVEQFQNDVWLTNRDWGQIPEQECKALILARQEAIKFVLGGIVRLKQIAASKEETTEQRAFRQAKDSAK